MQWRKLARLRSASGGSSRARNMLCCGRRKENGRSVPDLTASPGRAPPPTRLKDQPPMVIQSDFRKVSGISSEIFRQIETVENDHDATTAAALDAVERRGEMIVRILDLRHVSRAASEAAKRFFMLQDAKHTVQLVEIVKRPGQTLGLYIREGNGMDRGDGVFISRIALESAVYNSGCLKVGDEILAVNLVDVTHMSLDDVVIIMSIPRRLVLAIRQRKGNKGSGSPSLPPRSEHKPPPVVVIKRELRDEDMLDEMDHGHSNRDTTGSLRQRHTGDGREMTESRSRLGLGLTSYSPDQSSGLDLYYNSRPPSETPTNHWSYQPPPPVITEQPKSSVQHFQGYDRGYPKTLESLAEKVHSFYTGPVMPPQSSRRLSTGGQPLSSSRFSSNQRIMPRSGSDQHLPRVEYSDYTSISPAGRHTLLRSSLKSGSTLSRYNQRYATTGPDSRGISNKYIPSSTLSAQNTLNRRNRSLDYSSDTEATCGGSRSNYYYYNRNQPSSAINSLSRTNNITGGGDIVNKFNSLPRDTRASTRITMGKRFGTLDRSGISSILMDDADGNLSAPEMPHLPTRGGRGHVRSSSSVFTSDEYRSWLSRTPSTSAIYEQIRASRDVLNQHRAARFTYSAENIHDALKNAENSTFSSSYGLYSAGRSAITGTLDRNFTGRTSAHPSIPARSLSTQHITSSGMMGSPSTRRMRQLLELGSRGGTIGMSGPSPVPTPSSTLPRNRHVDINTSDFVKYKFDKPSMTMSTSVSGLPGLAVGGGSVGGISGMLWLHLLAGRGLRSSGSGPVTPTAPGVPPAPPPHATPQPARDLYCVLECDRVHKARTVVRTGDLQFDWDESFELDLVNNRQLDLLVYSWDPQHRHKLCYRGAINLVQILNQSPLHQLALKIEPRGTLFLRLRYTDSATLYRRRGIPTTIPRTGGLNPPLFGADLESIVSREASRNTSQPNQPPVPVIIRRCVEEIERRGLDIIGLYRLCGSATKKRILREAFERNSRSVELTPDNVPDINVITGVLKDYLKELPQPLFTKCLYQMTVDALGVCLPDDPEGNAKLMFSILDCLPRTNRATLIFLLDHLAMVVSVSDRNKMSPQNLATALAPPLMLQAGNDAHLANSDLDYTQPIGVLKYLLQIWPAPKHSVRRGEPAPGLHGNRASASPVGHSTVPGQYPPSASQYRQAAAASAALQAPLVRPSPAQSQVGHAQLSAKVGQYRPQSPRTGPLPAPPRSRQVIVSSPGSPSSSSDSQSGNETLKHGSSISSIARQPARASPGPTSTRPTYQTVPPSGRNSPALNQNTAGRNSPAFASGSHQPGLHQAIVTGRHSPAHHQGSPGRNSPAFHQHQTSTGRNSPARGTNSVSSSMLSGSDRISSSYGQSASSQHGVSIYSPNTSAQMSSGNGQNRSPRDSPNLIRMASPGHAVARTASPGIPGTNAGIAVTMNASPFLTDLSSSSLTNMENTLISNLQSTINNIGTTTDSIFNHTNITGNNPKINDTYHGKGSSIYGQKMPAVSSMAVNSAVPCYASYGTQSGADIFSTSNIGLTKQMPGSGYTSQSSDIFSSSQMSNTKMSNVTHYNTLKYSSTNPFLQNYPDVSEEDSGSSFSTTNLFDTLVSGGNDLLNDRRDGRGMEELTPTSSAGTEDSRTREIQDRDVEGDAEQSD